MYILQVFMGPSRAPDTSYRITRGVEAVERIPELLRTHAGCQRVTMLMGDTKLFSLNGQGQRLQD